MTNIFRCNVRDGVRYYDAAIIFSQIVWVSRNTRDKTTSIHLMNGEIAEVEEDFETVLKKIEEYNFSGDI